MAFNGSSSSFMQESFVEDYTPTIIELNDNFEVREAFLA